MRRPLGVVLTLSLVLITVGLAASESKPADSSALTVSGEILDMACYLTQGAKGPQHQKCAQRCAEMGQPIGLLTTEGEVYLLFADHADMSAFEKAKKLAGQNVEIRGESAVRDGVKGITVQEVEKL